MYVFSPFIQHLFPEHIHPKEGASVGRDQGGMKMSERFLSPVVGDRCGNRSSQHGATHTVGAHNPAAVWWGWLWKCWENGKLQLLELKYSFEIFRLLKNKGKKEKTEGGSSMSEICIIILFG